MKNKLPDMFTRTEIVKLFDVINNPKVGIAVALGFFCGLRISEVCNLKVEHLDFERRKLKVVDGKNSRRKFSGYGKDRYVPIPDSLLSPLKKWLELINYGVWLLPSDKSPDKPLRKKSLCEQFKDVLDKAGLLIALSKTEYVAKVDGKKVERIRTRHKYSFHTLRHSYATYLRNKDVDIQTISNLLGHSDISTTQIYARISDVKTAKAVEDAFSGKTMNYEPVRYERPPAPQETVQGKTPMEYLQFKFLQGEINEEEYLKKKELLS